MDARRLHAALRLVQLDAAYIPRHRGRWGVDDEGGKRLHISFRLECARSLDRRIRHPSISDRESLTTALLLTAVAVDIRTRCPFKAASPKN